MLLILRILFFSFGILYRLVAPSLNKPEPKSTPKGIKYGFLQHKDKNGNATQAEVRLPIDKNLRFRLRDESSWTRFCATIGFGAELKVGMSTDHEFDRRFYIASDDSRFLFLLKNDVEMQRAFLQLRDLGFESFDAMGDSHLILKFKGEFIGFSAIESHLEHLAEKLQPTSAHRFQVDPHFIRVVALEAVLYGLVGYSIGGYINYVFDPGLVHIELWPLVLIGITFGIAFIFIWLIFVIALLNRSAHAPLLVTDFYLAGLFIVVSAGPMFASDINRHFDKSKATIYRAGIDNSFSRTTGSGKNRRTKYYLSLRYVENPLGLPTEMEVSNWHRFSAQQGLNIEVRDGLLNIKYIDQMNTTSYPSELSTPVALNQTGQQQKRLLAGEAMTENLNWLEKMKTEPMAVGAKEIVVKYENGTVRSQETVLNGKKHGASFYHHENGQIYTSILWKEDGRHGSFKVYRADGSLEQWTSYKDGKPHGMFAWYSANGSKENPSHLAVYKEGEVIDGHRDSLLPLYRELMLSHFSRY